jgi:ADP-heptose:LPS heptosyltransferase
VKILAIRLARLGDVALLLPALRALKTALPEARLTLLTGLLVAPLADMCPAIDEVIAVDRVSMRDGPRLNAARQIAQLVRDIRNREFDLVIDFHSFRETNLLTWLSGAPARMGMKRFKAPYLSFCFNRPPVIEDKSLHVAEMFRRVVSGIPIPEQATREACGGLVIPPDLQEWARGLSPANPPIAFYVDAPVADRRWPPERFAEVADFAIEQFGAPVLALDGSGGSGLAETVRRESRNPDRIRVVTAAPIPELVALIASSRLLVSNDTGPMHVGPAVGVPTLGLFSVALPQHYRPIGPADRFLRGNPILEIQTRDVIEAVAQMWAATAEFIKPSVCEER